MKSVKSNQGGFTMIELIIVLAIMGILGAILFPTFASMRTNAQVTGDLTNLKTIDRILNTYFVSEGATTIGGLKVGDPAAASASLLTGENGVLDTLSKKGYLQTSEQNIQTEGAAIGFDGQHLYLEVSDDIYDKYGDSGDNRGTWLRK